MSSRRTRRKKRRTSVSNTDGSKDEIVVDLQASGEDEQAAAAEAAAAQEDDSDSEEEKAAVEAIHRTVLDELHLSDGIGDKEEEEGHTKRTGKGKARQTGTTRKGSKEMEQAVVLQSSQLFQPFRSLGFITDSVPFSVQRRGGEHFVTTCIERSYQTYNCRKLNLLQVGPTHEQAITCLATKGDFVFTSTGTQVNAWRRAKLVAVFDGHEADVQHMMIFGKNGLVTVDADNHLKVWDVRQREDNVLVDMDLLPADKFTCSVIMHPATYLNKLLVGSTDGRLQLWNLKTQKLVYEFGPYASSVTCVEQSTALDVVAVGFSNGDILVHNLKYDQTVMKFHQNDGPVTALSFRSDAPVLASGGTNGNIVLWDLQSQHLLHVMHGAHQARVTSLQFLINEAVLVSAGTDNALHMWAFTKQDMQGFLLRSRSGHSAPPVRVRYYRDRKQMLTGALDRSMRFLSTIQDQQNREFSQGSGLKAKARKKHKRVQALKLRPVVDFVVSTAKEREWDNVLSCHVGDTRAYTWNFERKALGEHQLRSSDHTAVRCVEISACGNLGLLGTQGGRIDKYNLQSGLLRRTFVLDSESAQQHQVEVYSGVQCVVSDLFNAKVVSGHLDGTLRFWNFQTGELLHLEQLEAGSIEQIVLHRDTSLMAVSADDFVIRVYDLETMKLVRRFEGHTNRITDMCFSPDTHWLITASMDTTVRVWNLSTAKLIDWFRADRAVTSLSFSPSGDFLVTTHVDSLGVYMWANRSQFMQVFLKPVPEVAGLVEMPRLSLRLQKKQSSSSSSSSDGGGDDSSDSDSEAGSDEDQDKMEEEVGNDPPQPLHEQLVTLSTVPASRWQLLYNLDTVKQRNKAKEPVKKPSKAPFFLPTLPGLNPKLIFDTSAQEAAEAEQEQDDRSRVLNMSDVRVTTPFSKLLRAGFHSDNYEELVAYVYKASPTELDVALQSLSSADNYEDHRMLLAFLAEQLESNSNFELWQSYLNVYMKHNSEVLVDNGELLDLLEPLMEMQEKTWTRVEDEYENLNLLVGFLSGLQ